MGILTIALQGMLVSATFSGIGRMMGRNLGQIISSQIPHQGARTVSHLYFKAGDVLLDGGLTHWRNYRLRALVKRQEQELKHLRGQISKPLRKDKN